MTRSGGTGEQGGALTVWPLRGIPEVRTGDDLAGLLTRALVGPGPGDLRDGDLVVVSSKVVSKSQGLRAAADTRAAVVLAQARRVVAERLGASGLTRVVESLAGPVLAAAGVDASNVGDAAGAENTVLLLPRDPDAAARELRAQLLHRHPHVRDLGVIVSDTAGRPWRVGQTDFALGAAGVVVLDDLRGAVDADGRALAVTARAVGDEIAAAADLVKGKAAGVPAALVRGLAHLVRPTGPPDLEGPPGPGAALLVRTGPGDWFAYGHVEAVRAALGVLPGTPEAVRVGVPAAGDEPPEDVLARAVAVAGLREGLPVPPPSHPRARLVGAGVDLSTVRADVVQAGVRLSAADPVVLGAAAARLVAALRGEGWEATVATPTDPGSALVVVL